MIKDCWNCENLITTAMSKPMAVITARCKIHKEVDYTFFLNQDSKEVARTCKEYEEEVKHVS